MNVRQRKILSLRNTDVNSAVRRLSGDEELYAACLRAFLEDRTIITLRESVRSGAWDDAFTAAHALKGVAGNMGFVPLMHAVGQLVVLIRGGRIAEIKEAMGKVDSCYRDITDGIEQFLALTEEDKKGEVV